MIYIKKDFEPDYNNIVLAAKNLQPKRTPIYEHVVSTRIFSEVTGITAHTGQSGDKRNDTIENYKNYNNMFKTLGYDAVCYEICAAGYMPGSGSLGGHKDGIIKVSRFGDDLGYKVSPMLAPDDVREHIVPQYARIINLIKKKTGKPFLLHSCGNLFEIMDDLISTGIDAKHSNEDVIAPFSEWVKIYGDRIGLFGGIDTDALCDISGIDIESYTREVVVPVINKPGIAIGSGNSITDYVSPERFAKMNEIVRIMRGE